ncbi:MAG: hypothetical protein ACKO6B_11720 [Planctomycetia bacterium]
MRIVVALFVTTVLLGGAVPPAWAADAAPRVPVDGQRVFVMGHSFHIFVADRLTPLARAAGIAGHELAGRQMIGGSSVRQHWNLPDRQNKAKAALVAGDVDVLTMSPNWLVPDDAIALFTNLGLEHNPRLRVLVQLSWMAYDHWEPVGDPKLWNPAAKIEHNDQRDGRPLDGLRAANAAIVPVVEKEVAAINRAQGRDVVRIVPVNDAVVGLRERVAAGSVPGIRRQSELFTDPIGHGRAPILALATYCNFACLYGRSPVGLDDGDRELDRIHPDLRPLLQRIAWETVTAHPLSGVTKNGFVAEPAKPQAVGAP